MKSAKGQDKGGRVWGSERPRIQESLPCVVEVNNQDNGVLGSDGVYHRNDRTVPEILARHWYVLISNGSLWDKCVMQGINYR